MKRRGLLLLGAFLLAASASCSQGAQAQSIPALSQMRAPEQVDAVKPKAGLDTRPLGLLAAPPGAESVKMIVASVEVIADFDPEISRAPATLPATGSEITLADIYELAALLQQNYVDGGYPLVRVIVPAQDLDPASARIKLLVVSGHIARIETAAVPDRIRPTVERYLAPLINKKHVTAADLERAVLLAGDIFGISLSTALSPGEQTGEAILIIDARFQPFQLAISADNRLARELGREQISATAAFNSIFGRGERISVALATTAGRPDLGASALRRYGAASFEIPLGSDGLVMGGRAALSTARPQGASAPLVLNSEFVQMAAQASYPLLRDRRRRLTAYGSLEANRESQQSLLLGFPVTLFADRISVARAGIDGLMQVRRDILTSWQIEFAQGLDILGARRASEASDLEPLSRDGADAVFSKLTASVNVVAGVARTPLSARLLIRGQKSLSGALLRSEQFSIATPDQISGPPSGILVGDSGVSSRLQVETDFDLRDVGLTPYAFAAVAGAWLDTPSAYENRRTDARASGLGLKMAIPTGAFLTSGQLEYSRTHSSSRNGCGNWLTFQITFRY